MAALTANGRHIKIVPLVGATLYYSYDTVIGVAIDATLYLTTEKYSVTTSRHARKFAYEFPGEVIRLTPEEFATKFRTVR